MRNALKPYPLKPSGRFALFPQTGGIGTQTVSDDFNRANQIPIAGNWTNGTSTAVRMQILSNTAQPEFFNSQDADCFYSAWVSGDNQFSQVEVTVTGTSAGAGLGPVVRRITTAGTKTYYRLVVDASGNYDLQKFIAGANTALRSGTVSYIAGQKLGLSATGGATTTLKIWYNNVQIGTDVTDSSSPLLTGDPGIGYSSIVTSASGDNWNAGTVP